MTRPLVLASTSRYRAELLARLEVPFETAAPDFDERALDHRFADLGPAAFALALARGKAESLRVAHPDAWILAADQIGVVEIDGRARLLTKTETRERAVSQLELLAGRTHELVSGVQLLDARTGNTRELVDRAHLTMRPFGSAEAERYVDRHRPFDTIGYRIEDPGIALFDRVESEDFTGIVGLPLIAVARLLREVELLPH